MNRQADKIQKNKRRSAAVSRNHAGESAFQFSDNSPEAPAQRKLKEIANNSSGVKQLKAVQEMADSYSARQSPIQKKENKTGLPDNLKGGIENLSGFSMDDVKVHYNSDKPAALQAHAYTQGTNIHIASGQEKHLPHEAWHLVQQKQGRVQPTMQAKGVAVNDEEDLEKEADLMGAKAFRFKDSRPEINLSQNSAGSSLNSQTAQRVLIDETDITSQTPYNLIVTTLGWSKNYGIGKALSAEQLQALADELGARKDCRDIVDDIKDELNESKEDSEEENGKDEEEEEEELDLNVNFNFGGFGLSVKEAARKKSTEDFNWKGFPDTHDGLIKIGIHETTPKNVESLVENGPSVEKLDTGHHLGKGPGFYLTPVGKKQQLYTAIKGMTYGEKFVAVYVPDSFQAIKSTESKTDNTKILDAMFDVEDCYYIMSGGGEIVVPVRCFPNIRVVSLSQQLFESKEERENKRLAKIIYEEELSFAARMNALSDRHKAAESESAKMRIAKKWNFLESRLFQRWSMDSRRYTLWWNVRSVSEHVADPVKP